MEPTTRIRLLLFTKYRRSAVVGRFHTYGRPSATNVVEPNYYWLANPSEFEPAGGRFSRTASVIILDNDSARGRWRLTFRDGQTQNCRAGGNLKFQAEFGGFGVRRGRVGVSCDILRTLFRASHWLIRAVIATMTGPRQKSPYFKVAEPVSALSTLSPKRGPFNPNPSLLCPSVTVSFFWRESYQYLDHG